MSEDSQAADRDADLELSEPETEADSADMDALTHEPETGSEPTVPRIRRPALRMREESC